MEISNGFRVRVANGEVNFSSDVFKAIVMAEGFSFNPATHALYADVIASEIGGGNGYTVGGASLSGVAIAQNNTDNRADVTWNTVSWTATGGDVGPCAGVIIYDDTLTGDPILGYINFGGTYTVAQGGTATVANIRVRL